MPAASGRPAPLRIFISYRRSDTQSACRQLSSALKAHFRAGDVFFDTQDLEAGANWRNEIRTRVGGSDALIAVIGPHWLSIAGEQTRRGLLDPREEDVLRLEIETALAGGVRVVPVLVDDAQMPARERLPRPFKPLASLQAVSLRHASWDDDVEDLIGSLEAIAAQIANGRRQAVPLEPKPAEARRPRAQASRLEQRRPTTSVRAAAAPGASHYEEVAEYVADGSVVLLLGSSVNAVDTDEPWEHGSGSPPDADGIARYLARRFRLESEFTDLAQVSQYVSLTRGKVDLYRTLRELLVKSDCTPGSVHRFLARLPRRLRQLDRERYHLIVTANYDGALEQAFDEVSEPYDLAVFIAEGEHKGRFLHIPWWDGGAQKATPISIPNEYVEFPIDEDGELERTVIVKVHGGAVADALGTYRLRDNYVITENDYIGYLSRSPVESLIPLQILNKMRESHFLFLGYGMRDWNLRVFLQRIWGEQRLGARSWAIQWDTDEVENEFWEEFGVDLYDTRLPDYVSELETCIERL